ncbi:four helix bundle protein [Flavobacterium sp.]|uniref:four helix bundle protein n=1 Tax=Flavobacterium sp. TaxID=239 RepID=UPI0026063820|nr:four helix bundle protein [Flavobacterium sp.]
MTKSFEEFEVYKKGVVLAKEIFSLCNTENFKNEIGFSNQIKRAVVSITNNIAEGAEYNNNRQLIRYLRIAKGSCGEVKSMLILAVELELCERNAIQNAQDLTNEIATHLSNFIKYLTANLTKTK